MLEPVQVPTSMQPLMLRPMQDAMHTHVMGHAPEPFANPVHRWCCKSSTADGMQGAAHSSVCCARAHDWPGMPDPWCSLGLALVLALVLLPPTNGVWQLWQRARGGSCVPVAAHGNAMRPVSEQNRTEQITWPQPARLITLSTFMWVLLDQCHCVPPHRERSCISKQTAGQYRDRYP